VRGAPPWISLQRVTTAKRLHYSYAEYLELLEHSAFKLEYCDGVIYAMAGGTPEHGALTVAMASLLREALRDGCTVYSSDVKVRIDATDLSTFPDVSVVCGPLVSSPADKNAISNPALLVEVTSRSTEDYDKGEKLRNYQQLPSLQAVVLISHRRKEITVVRRASAGWLEEVFRAGEVLSLESPRCEIPVDDVYRDVSVTETDA
jgi:Uma2 family endonuclease